MISKNEVSVENQQRTNEELFRSILESSRDAIYSYNLQTCRYEYVSPSFEEIIGYSAAEFMAMNTQQSLALIHPEDLPEILIGLKNLETVGRWDTEYRTKNKKGDYRWISNHLSIIKDSAGRALYRNGVFRDVTDRKVNGQALQQSEARFNKAFHSSPTAISITRVEDGTFIDINESYEQLLGYTRQEIIGHKITDLDIYLNAETRSEVITLMAQNGKIMDKEMTLRKKNRELIITLCSLEVIEAGNQKLFLGTILDISARKEAEQLKDEFIGMVSHEIRNPLAILMGALGTAMSEGITPADVRAMLSDALAGAQALNQIVNNLIELSRYQSDRLTIKKEAADVTEIINSVIEKETALVGNHKIITDFPDELPMLFVDSFRIKLILANLLSNAAKYSSDGKEIRILVRQSESDLMISVSDQGAGIPTEKQGCLFQAFERLENKERPAKGLGLGLLVCKRLVEAHGGKIWVESLPGKGSTFIFSLPL